VTEVVDAAVLAVVAVLDVEDELDELDVDDVDDVDAVLLVVAPPVVVVAPPVVVVAPAAVVVVVPASSNVQPSGPAVPMVLARLAGSGPAAPSTVFWAVSIPPMTGPTTGIGRLLSTAQVTAAPAGSGSPNTVPI
jgi:hypothetical protein